MTTRPPPHLQDTKKFYYEKNAEKHILYRFVIDAVKANIWCFSVKMWPRVVKFHSKSKKCDRLVLRSSWCWIGFVIQWNCQDSYQCHNCFFYKFNKYYISRHVKQLDSQTIHLSHELISCRQIMRRREDFNGDSAVKVLVSTEPQTFWTGVLSILQLFLPYRILAFSWLFGFQVAITWEDHLEVVTSKLSGKQFRRSSSTYTPWKSSRLSVLTNNLPPMEPCKIFVYVVIQSNHMPHFQPS